MIPRFQTLGAAAFALIAVSVSSAAVYDSYATGDRILFPPMPSESILTGQVSSNIPVNEFTSEQVANGVVLPKDSHNFFTCNAGGGVSTTANDLANTRAWIYEFTGNEPPFNGDFFISSGELAVNPQYDNLNTLSQITEGKRYYQMGEIDLRFQCGTGLSLTEACGDNSCQVTESAQSCPQDCNVCGDGVIYGAEECDDNNGVDNDGCDVFCEVEVGYACNAEPSSCSLLIPTLPGEGGGGNQEADVMATVVVRETGTTNVATENQKDVTLLRFEAYAQKEDLILTKASFAAAQGHLNNATNYTLWVDTDTDGTVDTIVEEGVFALSNRVDFNDLPGAYYFLPKETIVTFEVHADIVSSLTSDTLQLQFATPEMSEAFEMERWSDGGNLVGIAENAVCSNTLGCDMQLNRADSIAWKFGSQGNLYVTKDSTPLRNKQILGGTLSDPVLRLQFKAENEAIDVVDIQFTSSGSTATSIDRLELYREGESTKFAEATKGGCGSDTKLTTNPAGGAAVTTFCVNMENKQFVVPKDSDIDILVRPRLKTDQQGGISNEIISFFLGAGSSSIDNIVVQARGAISSNDLSMSDEDGVAEGEIFIGAETATANNNKNAYIVGNKNVSVLTKITSITNANPDANGTAVPTGMSAVGQFKVTAAAHNNSKNGDNDVVIDGIVFNVKATNIVIDATSFTLHNKTDSTKKASCQPHYLSGEAFTAANVSGAFTVLCNNLEASATDTEVNEGENETFVLSASITNPSLNPAGSSVLQVSLENFNSIDSSFGVTGSHIRWKDDDQFTNAVFDWIDYPEATVQSTSYGS